MSRPYMAAVAKPSSRVPLSLSLPFKKNKRRQQQKISDCPPSSPCPRPFSIDRHRPMMSSITSFRSKQSCDTSYHLSVSGMRIFIAFPSLFFIWVHREGDRFHQPAVKAGGRERFAPRCTSPTNLAKQWPNQRPIH